MKQCGKCKILKDENNFYKTGSYCKECQKLNKKVHYKNNKEQYFKNSLNNKKWFLELKKELKCTKCGYNKHPAALDFHHLDPKDKKFNITLTNYPKYSKEQILDEIKKCVVLCSNCHRIEHSKKYSKILKT